MLIKIFLTTLKLPISNALTNFRLALKLNYRQTSYLIYLTGIELEITIRLAGLAPCDLLDQNFHYVWLIVIFLVLCFSFRYMCVAVFIAFHFVFNNWYLESTFNQFNKKRDKKINHLSTKQFTIQFTLSSFHINIKCIKSLVEKISFLFWAKH